ncbi:MAG TPA: hypothetical protein VIG25_23990 [Pyrinomonadaceae bacterium]
MRNMLLFTLALMFLTSLQTPESSSLVVVSYKWVKTREVTEKTDATNTAPAREMIPQNKNFQRNVRVNDPVGTRDPNLDTIDGRRASIENSVQESRTPQPKPVEAFAYKIKIQNPTQQAVDILFWEYQFIDRANAQNITRRQFLCAANIKAGKEKEIQAFSVSGPSEVVSVDTLAKNSTNPFEEKVVINRVEYADGSIWQRKDWNFGEIRMSYRRAVSTPWGKEMCRGL